MVLLYSSQSLLLWECFALPKSLCFLLHILRIACVIQGRCLVFLLSSLFGACFAINFSRNNLSESKFSETDRDPAEDRKDSLNFTASVLSLFQSPLFERYIRQGCCLFIKGLMEQSVRTISWSETAGIDIDDFTSTGLVVKKSSNRLLSCVGAAMHLVEVVLVEVEQPLVDCPLVWVR